jgi:hypothetical protein
MARRPGFGRTDALVLLFILGGLAAVLVPAVQKVRASAARLHCQCRFCSAAMALLNYAGAHGDRFPAGTVAHPDLPPERRLSWVVEILPYIEEEQTFKRFDRAAGIDAPGNAAAGGTHLPWAVCVAAPKSADPVTHTVGVAGAGPDAATLPEKHPRAGVFGHDRRTAPAEITDGLASTLLLVEPGEPGRWAVGGPDTVRAIDPAAAPLYGPGRPFGDRHPDVSHNPFARRRWYTVVALADGHTRTFTSDTDPAVWAALATAAGGDSVPAE